MKKNVKKSIVIGLLAFALFAFITPGQAFAQWDFIAEADWNAIYYNRKMKATEIKLNQTYKCDHIRVLSQAKADGDPAKVGALVDKDGKRRLPRWNKGPEEIATIGNIVKIDTNDVGIFFIAFRDISLTKLDPQARLFQLIGTIELVVEGKDTVIGFKLTRGKILEDVNFKNAASFDQVMSIYSCVTEDPDWMKVVDIPKILKDNDNNPDKAADAVIDKWTMLSGGFGALSGAAPLWALPAEFAVGFVENCNKARLAYAVAQCYGKKPSDTEFKNDLYILFAGDDVRVTLKNVAKETGIAAAIDIPLEVISNEKVLAALGGKIAGSKAFATAIQKSPIMNNVASKFTAKGTGKAIAFVAIFVKGSMAASEAKKFGEQAKFYYRRSEEVTPAPAPKATGVTFQNNSGAEIQIIERKEGSNWFTVYAGSLKMNNKAVGVTLAPGKYNLRARTAAPFPQCTTFVKNGVEVKDGMTITFNANEKYKPTRAEYQEFIQLKCGFSNVNDVWKAMNTHPNADDLYRMWAESYPYNSNGAPPSSRPAKKTDQEIIVEWCKFKTPQLVWDAAAKHKDSKSLLKKWADSYYRK